MRKSLFVLILLFLSLSVSSISADYDLATTGKIAGRITDAATGDALPFVNIIVMGTNYGAASDIDGYYSILNIPPGTYEVKASAIGFNSTLVKNVRVSIDLTTNIDITLTETSVSLSEDVVVIATRPLIQKDLTASTAVIGDDIIRELPVTDLGDVLALQAGIVIGNDGGIHIRGGRAGQVAYQIDGVPVTDSYDGSSVVEVNQNAVKEMQVISGAFNAEYGQALSGVINLVTKDGSNNFSGSIQAYSGDYISNRTDVFWNIDEFSPITVGNIEGSLSGPILKDKLYFYTNIRYYQNLGYLYGRDQFAVTDFAAEVPNSGGADYWFIGENADGSFYQLDSAITDKYVSLNPFRKYFGQLKLTYIIGSGMKLSYNFIGDRQRYKDYNEGAKLTPGNNLQRFRDASTQILSFNHAISSSSFYTINVSYFDKRYKHYLFENIYTGNPNKPTEYVDNTFRQTPAYSYNVGGTDNSRFERYTKTYLAKFDWVSQLTRQVNLQFGTDYKMQEIYFHDINLVAKLDENGQRAFPYNVEIPPISSVDNNEYLHNPTEFSGYAQVKIEAFNMIINAGLRFDLFNPDGVVLADPTDPNYKNPLRPSNKFNDDNGNGIIDPGETIKTDADRLAYWYNDATIKTQISPRIGLAFPITDKGVIHFSYGHFFQLPRYEFLYSNPEFELGVGSGNSALFGNADLRPQKTVKGEIGLQQQIGEFSAIDVTVFFEDFRDLTGTQSDEILVFGRAQSYSRYANSDFGFSKGFALKYSQRITGGLAVNLDYTFAETKGNASNPADARNAVLGGALPETIIAPLDWDQTHTLNVSVIYAKPREWGFSIISNFFTGQPYTPGVNKFTRVTQNAYPRNSDTKPTNFNIDVRAYKDFVIGKNYISVFVRIMNLLDWENPTGVYGDTGDPYYTISSTEAARINPNMYYNTLDEKFTNPTFFSQPRRVELGLSYNF
ncbi:MAG: TonB-dependent receptor [Melioribacteraceae bacterium]|nr:TonB-dependent receptor [Melioribacteraceae bacterium]